MDNQIEEDFETRLINLVSGEGMNIRESKIFDSCGNFVVSLILLEKVCKRKGYEVAKNYFFERKEDLEGIIKCKKLMDTFQI